jgi:hypothetical protein
MPYATRFVAAAIAVMLLAPTAGSAASLDTGVTVRKPVRVVVAVSLRAGIAAFNREDYATAARIFRVLAERGDAQAQAYLGFMYQTGKGVPQHHIVSAKWYHRAAKQGHPAAQQALGLLFDKGLGVPEDDVLAHKWINLATSKASAREREHWARIRDNIATKMTPVEIETAEELAHKWRPRQERW